ncbi:MAG: metallophosphoesterase [Candidatus Riflebacteria bacterium]
MLKMHLGQPGSRKFVFFLLVFFNLLLGAAFAQGTEGKLRLTIMHTNDFHSHLSGMGPDSLFTPEKGDGDPVRGHAARLMTVIRSIKAHRMRNGNSTLLLDGGDALFGTLFHMLAPSQSSEWAPEYRFISEAGFDALCLGNHDFDADERGLAQALSKAKEAGYNLPFVTTNLRFATDKADSSLLRPFLKTGGTSVAGVALQDYRIKLLPGGADQPPVRVGILGFVGPNAAQLCATSRQTVQFVGFNDEKAKADEKAFHSFVQNRVDFLRNKEKCHIVIVLIHAGTPEDDNLAKAVKGIDLIISGHTHEAYVRKVGNTIISQAGYYGANLGVLDLEYSTSGIRILNAERPRMAINDAIPSEPDVLGWLKKAENEVDRLIEPSGFTMNDPVCEVTKDRRKAKFPNNVAGVFTANTLLRAVNRRLEKPVDIYFSTYGLVRSEYLTVNGNPTPYAFSDIFKFSPLGFAPDGSPGAPVVIFSLSRTEVKILLELMTMLSGKTPPYEPSVSGNLTYKINKFGVPLVNKLGKLSLNGKSLLKWPKRLRIATTLYFAQNLFKIRDMSKGIIRITPRDEAGNAITTFPDSGLPREHILLAEELRRVADGEVTDPQAQP